MKKIQRKKNDMRAEAELVKAERIAALGDSADRPIDNLIEDGRDEDLLFEE